MNQFVTLSKSDEKFWPMLVGSFSKDHFAQPVQNLNVNSAEESVTFKIIEKKSPSLLMALAQWYSLSKNIYLIFPILGGLSYLIHQHGVADIWLVASSFLALQFFLLALTLYNDYSDYITGIDRINENSSSKPLLRGLVRPYQARQLALLFFALAALAAVYCFVVRPFVLVLALAGLIVGLGISSTLVSRHFKGVSLVATFLLGGPLLVLGYEFLLFGKLTPATGLLGMVFGYHALKYDFTRQVRDIYFSSKAKLVTLSNYFGFERSKFIYSLMSIFHIAVLSGFIWSVQMKDMLLILVVTLGFEFYINKLFYSSSSFLSSNISQCLGLQKLHYTIECSLLVFVFLSLQWLSLF